jgi:NAD(P)-dependent dehydrogenase (short-subunit alcohol dehydrogenase family)
VTGNPGSNHRDQGRMIGMIKSIAAEYAKRGVTANAIALGFIATAMTDKLNDKPRGYPPGCPPDGWAPGRMARQQSFWPPTRPATSPGRRSMSTAGWLTERPIAGPAGLAARGRAGRASKYGN